jgi:hypothetical protein
MKLRRYCQFINESVEVTDDLINLLVERGEFWYRLMNLDYSEFDFTACYSDMCKKGGRNPKADFLKIQKHFDQIGFTLEKLKDLFSEENNNKCGYNLYDLYIGGSGQRNKEPFKSIIEAVKNKLVFPVGHNAQYHTIISPFSVGSSLDSQNAAVDVYLYFLFEELRVSGHGPVWLGGDGWGNVDLEDDDGGGYSEAFIRYRYGYHQTEYGKLWMEQCGVDEKWFEERAMADLQKYLEEEFKSIVGRVDRSKDMTGLSLDNYSIIEEDRIIIDLSKLVEDINNCPINRYWSGKKDYVVDVENIVAQFTKELEGFSLDIELTDGDDLIIWGKFKED